MNLEKNIYLVEPTDNFANQIISDFITEGQIELLEIKSRMRYIDPNGHERGVYKINAMQKIQIQHSVMEKSIRATIFEISDEEAKTALKPA